MIKIKWQQGLIIASFSAITACGGGGGGGGAQSSAAVMSSASSMLSSSSQSSVINLSPLAKIQFPRTDALTLIGNHYMTVSGVAYDDKGIRTVKVNGVAATLNTPSVAQSSDLPATHAYRTNWSVTLALPAADNPILVDVTDSDGLEVKNAAQHLNIRARYTPMGSVLDPLNDRMIGGFYYNEKFSVNLNTMESSVLSNAIFGNGMSITHDSTEIFSMRDDNKTLKLYANKLGTNIDRTVTSYDLGFDSTQYLWVDASVGVMSPDSKFYFAAVQYISTQENPDGDITKILKIDTSSGVVSVLKVIDFSDSARYVSGIFYVNNALLIVHPEYLGSLNYELTRIDTETGDQSEFMSVPQFELFATNHENTALYALSYDKFAIINLKDKTVVQRMLPTQGADVEFTQLAQLLVDQKRNRLLVSNSGTGDIFTIDIATGERSIAIKNGIGEGVGLVWPRHLKVTSDDKFAYVLDDRQHAVDMLFKIDLATGNRTTVSDLRSYDNTGTYGLILDEENNRIFFAMGLTIGAIDLTTGSQTVIASKDIGSGITMESFQSIGDMVYDNQSKRLLVASGWLNGFVAAIDPVTLSRTILVDSTMGSGPALTSISGMALDSENKKLYVSNTDVENKTSILSVNLETGDRTFLFDQCKNASSSIYQLVDMYETKILLDKKNQQVYATSNNEILVKDIASDKCRIINSPADDLALLSDSTLLGLSLGLVQINPDTGERAIISR